MAPIPAEAYERLAALKEACQRELAARQRNDLMAYSDARIAIDIHWRHLLVLLEVRP